MDGDNFWWEPLDDEEQDDDGAPLPPHWPLPAGTIETGTPGGWSYRTAAASDGAETQPEGFSDPERLKPKTF